MILTKFNGQLPRACLDQLLIAQIVAYSLRSRAIKRKTDRDQQDYSYTTQAWHNGVLSFKCRCRCLADYKHSMGRAGSLITISDRDQLLITVQDHHPARSSFTLSSDRASPKCKEQCYTHFWLLFICLFNNLFCVNPLLYSHFCNVPHFLINNCSAFRITDSALWWHCCV